MSLALRVAARFQRFSDQAPGARRKTRDHVRPVNKPQGIKRDVTREHGKSYQVTEESTKPDRRDLTPKDLFQPVPRHVNVKNLVEKGQDMEKALDKLPKDQGYDTVKNLSQYLIETKGGGGTSVVE